MKKLIILSLLISTTIFGSEETKTITIDNQTNRTGKIHWWNPPGGTDTLLRGKHEYTAKSPKKFYVEEPAHCAWATVKDGKTYVLKKNTGPESDYLFDNEKCHSPQQLPQQLLQAF